jgi:hypothetical protein
MHLRIIRLRKEYRFKVWFVIILVFCICYLFIPLANRSMLLSFFSTKCRNYPQVVFSRRLNDRLVDYYAEAKKTGIERCENQFDIGKRISDGKLFRVSSTRRYSIEKLSHSYPYLTEESKDLLNEIGKRFGKKVGRNGLKGSRFIITSMTRTSQGLKGLGSSNGNVSENSPHLNGNAFDISYARFSFIKLHVTECDKWFLKEALAEVIWQLRQEKKCWATYERKQGCFHVVSR